MSNIYKESVELGLTQVDRWGEGVSHHKNSEMLMTFLKEHDFQDYGNYFDFRTGGDGDNGETLMYQMDAFFEYMDGASDLQANPYMKLYVVEYPESGKQSRNYSTGTKFYTRLANAMKQCWKKQVVVEYELVPTGRVIEKE